MGLFSNFRLAASAAEHTSTAAVPQNITSNNLHSGLPIAVPSTMPMSVFHDFDSSDFPVTVGEALSVPAVHRGVMLYSSIISRLPLKGPAWLVHTDGAVTPALRLAQTVQDLILIGASVWSVDRDSFGFVSDAVRIDPVRWKTTAEGHISIDGIEQPDSSVIYFASIMPVGFLTAGRDSVRHYTNISRVINNRSSVPEPMVIVEQTDNTQAAEEEIDEAIENISEVLQSRRGGIVYQPQGINIRSFGGSDSANSMMIEARNAVRTDLANFLGLSAAILDGTMTGASDVYTNALQSQNELLELSIKSFSEPIADRLAQLDVSPPGERVRFDYSSFDTIADAAGNTGAPRPTNSTNEVTND